MVVLGYSTPLELSNKINKVITCNGEMRSRGPKNDFVSMFSASASSAEKEGRVVIKVANGFTETILWNACER
jgi:hypothetical protein